MTIREYIRRRVWRIVLIALVPFAALQMIVRMSPPSRSLSWASLIYFLMAVAWVVFAVHRISCPRCSKPLGAVAMAVGTNLSKVDGCPNCGVRVDEWMESLANRK
jgi:hypothetical protein